MLTCADHFAAHTYIKSLCGTSKTNTVLYVDFISIKLEKNKGLRNLTFIKLIMTEWLTLVFFFPCAQVCWYLVMEDYKMLSPC